MMNFYLILKRGQLKNLLLVKLEILITENLLEFMGFCDINNTCGKNARVINRYKLHNFIEFLNNNNIMVGFFVFSIEIFLLKK